ncbi:MAG TPA: MobF family relaxase, partial [Planctomycetaceae bacterium]|nr:MobF family relaxase [Planctomycetaceae bacterium]
MLRIIQNVSAAGAKSYYSTADYFTEGQELAGVWRGEGAARLGLAGTVNNAEWDALCDNRDPYSGDRLTLRQKDYRRVGYDFNWHAPKSLSLLYSLTRDERLLEAFRESVDETMRDMEVEMKTRVRKSGRSEDRTTGNMVYGEFVHFTARPVNGLPDPHLHAHCFVFNTTWDKQECAWKAGQFGDLKRDASYFEAKFHARLAHRLGELGLPVVRTKQGWELAGVERATTEKFSRRTAEIEAEARERGILDSAAKDELGAKTRKRKQKNL